VGRPHQGIDQRKSGACFARTDDHYQQKIALLAFNGFEHDTDRTNLIISAGDFDTANPISRKVFFCTFKENCGIALVKGIPLKICLV
jgi:hypothetical protein